jgi:hypothetical protein
VALWQQLLLRSVIPALLVWVIGIVIHLPVGAAKTIKDTKGTKEVKPSLAVPPLLSFVSCVVQSWAVRPRTS